jgi:uncharacterized membrane protein (DUF2068 family)
MESLQVNTSRDDRTESSAPPPQAQGSPQRTHAEHRRGLLLIGLFKLTKAVLAIGLGFGALKLLHHNVATVVLHIADALRIDPESHLVGLLMIKADLINPRDLRHFSMITFAYAVECLVEGTGLVLEKRWAEYFTVTLTSLALPLECYELYKEFTLLRVALLVVNLLVVVYLVWLLRRQLRRETAAAAAP